MKLKDFVINEENNISEIYSSLTPVQYNILTKIKNGYAENSENWTPRTREIVDTLANMGLVDMGDNLTAAGQRVLEIASKLGTKPKREAILKNQLSDKAIEDDELDDVISSDNDLEDLSVE